MEENRLGKNVSSGAEKVEKISEGKTSAGQKKKSADPARKGKPAKGTVKSEEQAAAKRLASAKAKAKEKERETVSRAERKQAEIASRAEQREKRLERRAALVQKRAEQKEKRIERAAQLKARREEREQQRLARKELLRNETKVEREKRREREKKERLALRRQRQEAAERAREQKMKSREAERDRRAQERKHKREQRTERRKRAPGYGGWLAAVISLGAACLVLATVVTTGVFRMRDMAAERAGGYRATLYEMVSVSGEMDDDLSKLKVSSGSGQQQSLLTDLVVKSALFESALERLPVDQTAGSELSAFVNRTGSYARRLLSKVSGGEELTETEKNTIAYLGQINAELYRELNELSTHLSEKELSAFLAGGSCATGEKFREMGERTLAEPERIVDAPFSDEGNVGENRLSKLEEVSLAEAEERVKNAFGDGRTVTYAGETAAKGAECYQFTLRSENGSEGFAQVTKRGGKIAYFGSYDKCEGKNFDLSACDAIAKEFLSTLGIDDVEAVWLSDGGMVADLTYVAVQNGVRLYPDMIRIRVCESRGKVIGMDAMNYFLNHAERQLGSTLSRESAQEMLNEGLTAYSAHLAVIPVNGEEILAHEFACTSESGEFLVYLDAETGAEVRIYRVHEDARGSYLK